MKLNTKLLLKTVSLLSLTTPLVYAGDCTELEEYYKNKDILYISNCEENDNGKIIKLNIYDNEKMTDEDIEKILSYDTITNFRYATGHDGYDFESNPDKVDKLNDINKLTNLKNLKNLENLVIEYDASRAIGIGAYKYYLGEITKDTLKDLKSLKSLEIVGINLSQDNIEEISSLTNLESLIFKRSSFNKSDNYESLNELKNLKDLEFLNSNSNVPNELVNTIKSIETLVLLNSGSFYFEDLPNLKRLDYDEEDLSSLKNLKNLRELNLSFYSFRNHDLSSLENVNQITKLVVSNTKIVPGAAVRRVIN